MIIGRNWSRHCCICICACCCRREKKMQHVFSVEFEAKNSPKTQTLCSYSCKYFVVDRRERRLLLKSVWIAFSGALLRDADADASMDSNDGFIQCAMTCDIYIYQKSQRHAPLLMAEMTMQFFDTVVTLINHQALTTGCL